MKYEQLVVLLYEYCYREQVRCENDLIQLNNNIGFRRADPLDHLEMILALVRLQRTEEISRDIYRLVAISKGMRYTD